MISFVGRWVSNRLEACHSFYLYAILNVGNFIFETWWMLNFDSYDTGLQLRRQSCLLNRYLTVTITYSYNWMQKLGTLFWYGNAKLQIEFMQTRSLALVSQNLDMLFSRFQWKFRFLKILGKNCSDSGRLHKMKNHETILITQKWDIASDQIKRYLDTIGTYDLAPTVTYNFHACLEQNCVNGSMFKKINLFSVPTAV